MYPCYLVAKSSPTLCNLRDCSSARLPCPALSPRVCSNSCPLSQWCNLTISSSVAPFFFCLQPFSASGSFPVSWLFTSGGQSIGASASASPSNEYSRLISLKIQVSIFPQTPPHPGCHITLSRVACAVQCVGGCVSRLVVSNSLQPHGLQPARLLCPWNSPGKNTGVGCHSFLQEIFPTQGSNSDLLNCRQILYPLSYQRNPVQ